MREAPRPQEGEAWKSLYTAALFESDLTKLSKRIAAAEQALVLRAGELFHATGDHIEEEEALNKAMYSLNALRNAYECRSVRVQCPAEAA